MEFWRTKCFPVQPVSALYTTVARYVGVCCPEGQENSGSGVAHGLPGSEAAGQLPAIDPGLPGVSLPGSDSPGPTPHQVKGQYPHYKGNLSDTDCRGLTTVFAYNLTHMMKLNCRLPTCKLTDSRFKSLITEHVREVRITHHSTS
jgi:hypothetical protein